MTQKLYSIASCTQTGSTTMRAGNVKKHFHKATQNYPIAMCMVYLISS